MKLPRETIEGGEKTAEGRTQRTDSILGENTVVETSRLKATVKVREVATEGHGQ